MSVFVGILSVFCRIFVGFLQQYLKYIILKIYENSLQKRLCRIHNLDQSVFGQSLSGLRQNAASVDCIREGFFYRNILYYYQLGVPLFLTRCAKLGRWAAQICFSCIFLENNLFNHKNFYIFKILDHSSPRSRIVLPKPNHNTVVNQIILRDTPSN